ncbi:GNAT family N-acetyltransferase [Erythrobacter sp. F6033]|uniref:GNAT family N-acetyltransferase n=1 Tax=Erythrobacter sp. F6033 TaxID=2926401 RepID=UPI001FF44590|nr:GNAT family N-acetyltransferase [Erythrobacter sp. F6033]MCK0128674.1 GNAT family N-acetyltransferase [Erythrobacter sp. F6033]
MKNHNIRPLESRDLERARYLVGENEMFPPEMLEDMTAPFFENDPDQRWVVFDDGAVDGIAYYLPEQMAEGVWNLLMIAVDPKRHGQGLGTQLMRFVEAELAAAGNRILLVDTSGKDEFERTRSFYDMLGYDREACIRDYWTSGDDKVTFRKVLT